MNRNTAWSIQSGLLDSPGYDSLLIAGVLFIALLSGAIVFFQPSLFGPVLFIDIWFLGYHHVIATFTKLAGTPQDRQENRFLIYHLPFIVLTAVFSLYYAVGVWIIATIYFFWQWYHYVRQAYGISTFYRKKAPLEIDENPTLARITLWAIPAWGIIHRCEEGWDEFLGLPIWMPYVPPVVEQIAATIALSSLAWWILSRIRLWRLGTLSMGYTCFTASHFVAFYVGYILMPHIDLGWLVANVWHNAQYILFVWLYNTNRFGKPQDDPSADNRAPWIAWLSQRKGVRILLYFTGCLAVTSLFYGTVFAGAKVFSFYDFGAIAVFYVVAFQTINFHHYIVDSQIWKARKKSHQKVMHLRSQ